MRIRPLHLLIACVGLAPLPLLAADNSCTVPQFSAALLQRNNASVAADLQRAAPAFASLAQLQAKVQPDQPMAAQLSAAEMQQVLEDGRQIRIATALRALELNQNDEIQVLSALLQVSEQVKAAADAWLSAHGTLAGFSASAALDAAGVRNLKLLEHLMVNWRQTQAGPDGDLRAAIGSLSDRPTAEALTKLTGVDTDH